MYLVLAFLPFFQALDGDLLLGLGPRWFLALGKDLELVAGVGNAGDALHQVHWGTSGLRMNCLISLMGFSHLIIGLQP